MTHTDFGSKSLSCDRPAGWAKEGYKDDHEKPKMDLIDAYAMEELAKVLTFGAKKYAPNNWRKGMPYGRMIAAVLRHLYAILRGEDTDLETGLPHAAHAMCGCMFLVWGMKHRTDLDDRWKPGHSSEEKSQLK